jgi:hypothetical protein
MSNSKLIIITIIIIVIIIITIIIQQETNKINKTTKINSMCITTIIFTSLNNKHISISNQEMLKINIMNTKNDNIDRKIIFLIYYLEILLLIKMYFSLLNKVHSNFSFLKCKIIKTTNKTKINGNPHRNKLWKNWKEFK